MTALLPPTTTAKEFCEGKSCLEDTLQVTEVGEEVVTVQILSSMLILGVSKLR